MSHAPIEHPSDLTPLQRQYLRNIWKYLDAPPTLGRIYRRTALMKVMLFLFGGISVLGFLAFDEIMAACIIGGVFAGIFLRDFGTFTQAVRLWPATEAVINRRMLAHLLDEHSRDPDPADAHRE